MKDHGVKGRLRRPNSMVQEARTKMPWPVGRALARACPAAKRVLLIGLLVSAAPVRVLAWEDSFTVDVTVAVAPSCSIRSATPSLDLGELSHAWVGDGIDRLFVQQPFPVCVVLTAGRAQASHPNARCSAFRFTGALRGFLLDRHKQGSSFRRVFVRQHGAGRLELQRSLKPGCDSDKPNSNSELVLGVIGPVPGRRRLFRYAQLQRKRRALIAFLLKLCAFVDFAK